MTLPVLALRPPVVLGGVAAAVMWGGMALAMVAPTAAALPLAAGMIAVSIALAPGTRRMPELRAAVVDLWAMAVLLLGALPPAAAAGAHHHASVLHPLATLLIWAVARALLLRRTPVQAPTHALHLLLTATAMAVMASTAH